MKRINHRKDYATALKRVEVFMPASPTRELLDDEELNPLANLIEQYEKETVLIPRPLELAMLRFRMEESG